MTSPVQPRTSRTKQGIVVSTKMQKTAVVAVHTTKRHPKYQKAYHVTTKFLVHDPDGLARVGETVTIAETRPLSRHKRWRLVK